MPPEGSDLIFDNRHNAAVGEFGEHAAACTKTPAGAAGLSHVSPGGYVGAANVRPREAADQAAAGASLARHNTLRVARLGELVHPLNYTMWTKVVPGVRPWTGLRSARKPLALADSSDR